MSGAPQHKVLLMRLYERVSASGNRYLAGRLGAAKVIAFIDPDAELQYGATAMFNVYVQDAEQDGQKRSASESQASSAPRREPRRHQEQREKPAEKPADGDGRPFSDRLDDLPGLA